MKFYPDKKGGGKGISHAEGGVDTNKFLGSFNTSLSVCQVARATREPKSGMSRKYTS